MHFITFLVVNYGIFATTFGILFQQSSQLIQVNFKMFFKFILSKTVTVARIVDLLVKAEKGAIFSDHTIKFLSFVHNLNDIQNDLYFVSIIYVEELYVVVFRTTEDISFRGDI